MIEKLYTVEEVAELASVTGRTIRNYLKSGRLKGRKIGGQWRFPEAEVQRLLTGAEPEPEPSAPVAAAEPPQRESLLDLPEPPAPAPESSAPIADAYPEETALSASPPQSSAPAADAYSAPYSSPNMHSSVQNNDSYADYGDSYANSAEESLATPVESPLVSAPSAGPSAQPTAAPHYAQPAPLPSAAPPPMAQPTTPLASQGQPAQAPGVAEPLAAPQAPAMPPQPAAPTSFEAPGVTAPGVPPASSYATYEQPLPQAQPQNPLPPQFVQPDAAAPLPPYTTAPTPAPQVPPASPPSATATPAAPMAYAPQQAYTPAAGYVLPQGGVVYDAATGQPVYFAPPAQIPPVYPPSPSMGGYYTLQQQAAAPEKAEAPPAEPPKEEAEPAPPAPAPAASELPEFSDVGKRVTRFISEVHDCSHGPQICTMIDLHQSLTSAKATSEKLADIADEESAQGMLCQCFVEFDDRYYVARYTLFGTSTFLMRCLKLLG